MSDDDVGRVEFGPRSRSEVPVQLGVAIFFLGCAIAVLALASRRVSEKRRQPRAYETYAGALESRCAELAESVEVWRERAVTARELVDSARELVHEARVREQVAISGGIGGPLEPWGPPGEPDAGNNGRPAEEGARERRD